VTEQWDDLQRTTRAQCIVYRDGKLLMVRHREGKAEYWCLPGGGVEPGELSAEAALRELEEECGVKGTILCETSRLTYSPTDQTHTFLVDIGEQIPSMGSDPEFSEIDQIMVDVRWLALDEIPERDRVFLWAAGLLAIEEFFTEVSTWGDSISYPLSRT
jgi:8-oxo-dGTP pyrophosphatase MutT (NUDIX family)